MNNFFHTHFTQFQSMHLNLCKRILFCKNSQTIRCDIGMPTEINETREGFICTLLWSMAFITITLLTQGRERKGFFFHRYSAFKDNYCTILPRSSSAAAFHSLQNNDRGKSQKRFKTNLHGFAHQIYNYMVVNKKNKLKRTKNPCFLPL